MRSSRAMGPCASTLLSPQPRCGSVAGLLLCVWLLGLAPSACCQQGSAISLAACTHSTLHWHKLQGVALKDAPVRRLTSSAVWETQDGTELLRLRTYCS